MRRSIKTALYALALCGLCTASTSALAKGPTSHHHHSGPSQTFKALSFAKPQNGSHPGQTFASHGLTFAANRQIIARQNTGGPIFVPLNKAQQAKQIHDQRVQEQQNGGPIFVPLNKAQQAKQIHDQRVQQQTGGPVLTPLNKAQQAKQIHDQRVQQQQQQGVGLIFVPRRPF